MVAKSYQSLEIVGDVFTKNNRQYVQVKTKDNTFKTVRWYSQKEYERMYGETIVDKNVKSQKDVLGFDKGYITLIKTDDEEWLESSPARYATPWGWYFPSTAAGPSGLPQDAILTPLYWDKVGDENGFLKKNLPNFLF